MQKHIISRLAVFGRQSLARATIPRVAVSQRPLFRAVPMAMLLHTTPARFEQEVGVLVAQQMERDAVSAARRAARKKEIEELPEEERAALVESRRARRKDHIADIEGTITETWVPLHYAVEKYRRSSLAGPNYRGAGISWFMRNSWVLRLLEAKPTGVDGRREVSKERVDMANFRVLRMSRDLEVDLDEEWDGDLEADYNWPKPEKIEKSESE